MSRDYENFANMMRMAAVFSDLMNDTIGGHTAHIGISATPIVTNRRERADLESMNARKMHEFNHSIGMDDDAVCTSDTCEKCNGQCKEKIEPDVEGYDDMSDFMKEVYDALFPEAAARIKAAKAEAKAKADATKSNDTHEPVADTFDDEDELEDDICDDIDGGIDLEDDTDDEFDDSCGCGCDSDYESDGIDCDGNCALCLAQRNLNEVEALRSELDTVYESLQAARDDLSELKGMIKALAKEPKADVVKKPRTKKAVENVGKDIVTEQKAEPKDEPKAEPKAEVVKKPRKPRTKKAVEPVEKADDTVKVKKPRKPRTKKTTE